MSLVGSAVYIIHTWLSRHKLESNVYNSIDIMKLYYDFGEGSFSSRRPRVKASKRSSIRA